jgi:hypothetical protein
MAPSIESNRALSLDVLSSLVALANFHAVFFGEGNPGSHVLFGPGTPHGTLHGRPGQAGQAGQAGQVGANLGHPSPSNKGGLSSQVVNQSEGILHVAAGKVRFILDDFASVPYQPLPCFFYVGYRDFENRPQGRAALDKEVDVFSVKTDHVRQFIGDLES